MKRITVGLALLVTGCGQASLSADSSQEPQSARWLTATAAFDASCSPDMPVRVTATNTGERSLPAPVLSVNARLSGGRYMSAGPALQIVRFDALEPGQSASDCYPTTIAVADRGQAVFTILIPRTGADGSPQ